MATTSSPFGLNTGTGSYPPVVGGLLIFGSDYGHSNFVTPMARFEFYDNMGKFRANGSPIIFIRMAGAFQSALQNGYQESQNIFGSPTGDEGKIAFTFATVKGGIDALLKQAVGAAGTAGGFIGSAGLAGKAQYEFMTRKVLNTFQQLIYSGPTFRRFTLPFVMKPTSKEEAEIMINIIKSFRIASSAKGEQSSDLDIEGTESLSTEELAKLDKEAREKAEAENTKLTSDQITSLFAGGNVAGSSVGRTFTFGYPDMCKFQIILQDPTTNKSDGGIAEVFGSEFCVIESVQVDYGSQNKMVFFSNETKGGKYYPSEVTLNIGLRETTLPLAGQIDAGQSGLRTIF